VIALALGLLTVGGCASAPHRGGAKAPRSTGRPAGLPTGSSSHRIEVAGRARSYRTYVPAGLDPSEPAPLVVMLHGGFGSAAQAERSYGWDAQAEAGSFVVAYPDGDGRAWNAGTCCGASAQKGIDDVAFITAVVDAIGSDTAIDPRRIHVTGMSNGAMMAQRLACDTDVFAAMASVAGAQMVPCEHPEPISVLHIHGTADTHVPMDGSTGNGRGRVVAHTPVTTSIARWRKIDDCAPATSTTHGVVTTSTARCAHGRSVTLTTVAGAGHQWPGSDKSPSARRSRRGADAPSQALGATETIWAFFAAHPRPEA
jgi:polyhydroxybutyrate depolymerase